MRCPALFLIFAAVCCGCSGDAENSASRDAAPRPVSVITLRKTDPARSLTVTGTVGSWKTEDIGFEVSGRIQRVIEPETNVNGPDNRGEDESPLAQINPEKYETAVESAKANIAMLTLQKTAAEIERDQVLPAQRDGAVATQELAQGEFDRGKDLLAKDAITQAAFDKLVADLKGAQAKVAQLDATREAKTAEVTSFDAQIDQAKAALKDAERDLKDCAIQAPFRGQIAKVHVIPGGTVQRGEPVVTVQMMDPLKVEFEVSAQRARQLQYKEGLHILLARPDGSTVREEGVIYLTDATADPSTRTFTITVLIRNRLVPEDVPEGFDRDSLPKTRDIWSLIRGILGDDRRFYVEQHAIHKDNDGEYLWRVVESGEGASRSSGPILNVEKVRVTVGEERASFLGLWDFRDVVVDDPAAMNPERDRVLGKLVLPEGETELTGGTVLFEREHWLLRPGDLVGVEMSETSMPRGF